MATVFLAEHPRISKRVAVKVINPELATSSEMVSRFLSEARAASQINHEHVVDILDFGQTEGGDNFMIMEYLEGQTLSSRVQAAGSLDSAVAQNIALQITEALIVAHQLGVVHRDLKPDNIFLIKRPTNLDYVKILDFGLAKLLSGFDGVQHRTRSGSVLGTPHYMAPEQCEGRVTVDGRADLYSIGCMLFYMVTGCLPFPADGFAEAIIKHLTEMPPRPRTKNPQLSPAFEKLILHCLAKNRDYRFQSAEELLIALKDCEKWSAEFGEDPLRIHGPVPGAPNSNPSLPTLPGIAPAASPPVRPLAEVPFMANRSGPQIVTVVGKMPAITTSELAAMAPPQAQSSAASSAVFAAEAAASEPGAQGSGRAYMATNPVDASASAAPLEPPLPSLPPPAASPSLETPDPSAAARTSRLLPIFHRMAKKRWSQAFLALPPANRLQILRASAAGFALLLLLLLLLLLWPRSFSIEVGSVPAQAEVLLDGKSLGKTPLQIALKRGAPSHLVLRKPGYKDYTQELVGGGEKAVQALLVADSSGGTGGAESVKNAGSGQPADLKKPAMTSSSPGAEPGDSSDAASGKAENGSDETKKKKKRKKKKVRMF